jgi:hypothetical protein
LLCRQDLHFLDVVSELQGSDVFRSLKKLRFVEMRNYPVTGFRSGIDRNTTEFDKRRGAYKKSNRPISCFTEVYIRFDAGLNAEYFSDKLI